MDINIIWSRVSDASFYHLYTTVNLPDNFVMIGTPFENTEAVIKKLKVGKTYFFYVTVIDEYGVESGQNSISID